MKRKMYIAGSIFKVRYKYDGRIDEENILLARTYEPDKLFQVITVSGYHAGEIEGYISYQFDQNVSCSFEHLKKELEIWVYGEVLDLKEVQPRYAQFIDWEKLGY